jgi:hypothetical protein
MAIKFPFVRAGVNLVVPRAFRRPFFSIRNLIFPFLDFLVRVADKDGLGAFEASISSSKGNVKL